MVHKQQVISLEPGRLYLGGTMTAYGVLKSDTGCLLTGVRFWPGGFYALFPKAMQPKVDSVLEFPEDELRNLMLHAENLDIKLDRWFDNRSASGLAVNTNKYAFVRLRQYIYNSGGTASVEELADVIHVSKRTLERIFKKNVGISPKEFLRIVRFQEVLRRLQSANVDNEISAKESLLQIAFELGYYDHAHLTNEFKKYSGVLPSQLSLFYKSGIHGNQYF